VDAGRGVQVPGDLAVGGAGMGLVAEGELADGQFVGDCSVDSGRPAGIVVAGNPDPFATALQAPQKRTIAGREPGGRLFVVEGVAKRDNGLRLSRAISRARRASVSTVS
jgi:hypothetical protein